MTLRFIRQPSNKCWTKLLNIVKTRALWPVVISLPIRIPNISRLAANLISDKYQLSKYHTKFRELEQEEDKLDYLVPREIYSMKDAYILYKIKDIQAKIKEAQNKGDMEQIFDLMKQNAHLNEIKNVLCKELGERIVLKM